VETRRRHPIGCCSIFVGLGMWFLDPALLLYLHIYTYICITGRGNNAVPTVLALMRSCVATTTATKDDGPGDYDGMKLTFNLS